MIFILRRTLFATSLLLGLLLSANANAQSSACCSKDKEATAKTADCTTSSTGEATSGCTPSSCRGTTTKFGEAKVITNLRALLIDLKATMEKSENPKFDARSYDIHGIVGETDDESLAIIVKEVKLIASSFEEQLNYKSSEFELPESKAKQVQYLSSRIAGLRELL